MSTGFALILLCLALALVVSAGVMFGRRPDMKDGFDRSAEGTAPVESELLRRPLRSRYTA